jgi:hypothetical protein
MSGVNKSAGVIRLLYTSIMIPSSLILPQAIHCYGTGKTPTEIMNFLIAQVSTRAMASL